MIIIIIFIIAQSSLLCSCCTHKKDKTNTKGNIILRNAEKPRKISSNNIVQNKHKTYEIHLKTILCFESRYFWQLVHTCWLYCLQITSALRNIGITDFTARTCEMVLINRYTQEMVQSGMLRAGKWMLFSNERWLFDLCSWDVLPCSQ